MKVLFLLCFYLVTSSAYPAIYQWKDKQGEVHFSDTPHKGAKVIELPEVQTFTPEKLPKIAPVKAVKLAPKPRTYTIVAITRPEQEATIRNNQGFVAITVDLEPKLAKSDSLQLYLDGEKVGKPQQAQVFTLYDIYRGAHSVQVKVSDSNGKVISQSEEVTFYMHRPRVGMGSRVEAETIVPQELAAAGFAGPK